MVTSVIERSEVNQVDLNSVLNPKHQRDLIHKRGLDPAWVLANCKSVDAKTASELLGYKVYSPGIIITGHGYQIQFIPDSPWVDEKGKKSKYLTPKDEDSYDVMLPRHPEDPRYWDDLEALKSKCYQINGTPCLVLTEGFFKAMSLTSHGIPTVAILGVEQGLTSKKRDPQEKRYLVPLLERFVKAGFGFIIGFDADCVRNENVIKAQHSLGFQLLLFSVPVHSITGLWFEQHESGKSQKGIDDYIQLNGYEKFNREVLSKAETFEEWKEKHLDVIERQFNKSAKKPPTPRETSKEIAEDYQNWRYHNQQKTWRLWNSKYWESIDDGVFRSTVKTDIDGRGVNYSKADYISNVVSLVTDDLRVANWKTLDRFQYIPFDNGVLEIATRKLREHDPDDGLLYVLPHAYKPVKIDNSLESLQENCPQTYRYMMTAQQNNPLMVKKMLATINGVVTGKFSQLQMFVQLIGKTRAGKGTFTRLLRECIGEINHASATLEDLAKPEMRASIIDKMLVEFPEQRSTNEKAISWLLALTGGDSISCKRLYRDPTSEQFYGTPIITSNRQIGTAKFPELEERLCLITFNHTIPKADRIPNLDKLIKAEIPQLIAIALSLSDSDVTQLLKGVGEGDNPAVKLHQWELKTEESVLAAFFNDELIVESGKLVTTSKLYEEFRLYCMEQGKQPLSLKRFARELDELCEHLDLSVVWNKEARHSRFEGLRLRKDWEDVATYEDLLRQSSAPIERVQTPIDAPIDAPIETQTQKEIAPIAPIEENTFSNQGEVCENSDESEHPPESESQFKEGDRVTVLHDGRTGEVIEVNPSRIPSVRVRLDNSVEIWERPEHLELVPPKKPEPKPQKEIKLKPALVEGMTSEQKKKWLHNNQGTNKPVWVKLDNYEGEAILKGKTDDWDKWKVYISGRWGNDVVSVDCIEVLYSQLGKFKFPPKPPEGDQIELNFDTPPQAEVPPETPK